MSWKHPLRISCGATLARKPASSPPNRTVDPTWPYRAALLKSTKLVELLKLGRIGHSGWVQITVLSLRLKAFCNTSSIEIPSTHPFLNACIKIHFIGQTALSSGSVRLSNLTRRFFLGSFLESDKRQFFFCYWRFGDNRRPRPESRTSIQEGQGVL
jgi:hypothetical protein